MVFLQKAISILISLLILGYSGGLSVSTHFCNEDLVDRSILLPAKKCEAASRSIPYSQDGPSVNRPSCCLDIFSEFQSDSFARDQAAFFPEFSAFAIVATPYELNIQKKEIPFLLPNQKAPPNPISKHILYEQFLI